MPFTSALRMTFTRGGSCDRLWSIGGERHQRDHAGAFHRVGESALMTCAIAGNTAGQDLAPLGDIFAKTRRVLIVEIFDLLDAERTDFALRLAVFRCAFFGL